MSLVQCTVHEGYGHLSQEQVVEMVKETRLCCSVTITLALSLGHISGPLKVFLCMTILQRNLFSRCCDQVTMFTLYFWTSLVMFSYSNGRWIIPLLLTEYLYGWTIISIKKLKNNQDVTVKSYCKLMKHWLN